MSKTVFGSFEVTVADELALKNLHDAVQLALNQFKVPETNDRLYIGDDRPPQPPWGNDQGNQGQQG